MGLINEHTSADIVNTDAIHFSLQTGTQAPQDKCYYIDLITTNKYVQD